MDRAQEKQFIDEHVSSWQLVKCTWLAFAVIIAAVAVYASSPLVPSDVRSIQVLESNWFDKAPKLQHQDDDPGEFFDLSEH